MRYAVWYIVYGMRYALWYVVYGMRYAVWYILYGMQYVVCWMLQSGAYGKVFCCQRLGGTSWYVVLLCYVVRGMLNVLWDVFEMCCTFCNVALYTVHTLFYCCSIERYMSGGLQLSQVLLGTRARTYLVLWSSIHLRNTSGKKEKTLFILPLVRSHNL